MFKLQSPVCILLLLIPVIKVKPYLFSRFASVCCKLRWPHIFQKVNRCFMRSKHAESTKRAHSEQAASTQLARSKHTQCTTEHSACVTPTASQPPPYAHFQLHPNTNKYKAIGFSAWHKFQTFYTRCYVHKLKVNKFQQIMFRQKQRISCNCLMGADLPFRCAGDLTM